MRTVRIVIVAAFAALSASCGSGVQPIGSTVPAPGAPSFARHTTNYQSSSPDLAGVKIYVADPGVQAVTAFGFNANGNVKPSFKIFGSNTGLTAPNGIDNDGTGQSYVLNFGNPTAFEVFAAGSKGNVAPKYVVSGALTQLDNPQDLAVDPSGTTYVTNSTGGQSYISVYAAGSNGDRAPIATIFDGQNFFFIPDGIALFNGTLYVADQGDQSINEYPASSNGTVNPTATITGLSSPRGVAVDTKGRIYVTDSDRVLVYAANANGNATPLRTISGSNTHLAGATGLAVHGSVIIVANDEPTQQSVTVYPLTGNGNIAPLREISGSMTFMSEPIDVDIH